MSSVYPFSITCIKKSKVEVTGSQNAKHISVEGDQVAGVSLHSIKCPPLVSGLFFICGCKRIRRELLKLSHVLNTWWNRRCILSSQWFQQSVLPCIHRVIVIRVHSELVQQEGDYVGDVVGVYTWQLIIAFRLTAIHNARRPSSRL